MPEQLRIRFPRIPHLRGSPGRCADDLVAENVAALSSCTDLVVTEKLDGENTTLYSDYLHARSPTFSPHPSRSWVQRLHGSLRHRIPAGVRICGENLFAQHSIAYDRLPSYFLAFAVFRGDECLSWDDTVGVCADLGLEAVPVLYRGMWDESAISACFRGESVFGPQQEGFVVRDAGAFAPEDVGTRMAKWVRQGHVQTDGHWMTSRIVPNRLRREGG